MVRLSPVTSVAVPRNKEELLALFADARDLERFLPFIDEEVAGAHERRCDAHAKVALRELAAVLPHRGLIEKTAAGMSQVLEIDVDPDLAFEPEPEPERPGFGLAEALEAAASAPPTPAPSRPAVRPDDREVLGQGDRLRPS